MCSGREFQVWAAATGKARLPTVGGSSGAVFRSDYCNNVFTSHAPQTATIIGPAVGHQTYCGPTAGDGIQWIAGILPTTLHYLSTCSGVYAVVILIMFCGYCDP